MADKVSQEYTIFNKKGETLAIVYINGDKDDKVQAAYEGGVPLEHVNSNPSNQPTKKSKK